MTHEQITARLQNILEPVPELILGIGVEIDRDIAAKNNIERSAKRPGFDQIQLAIGHEAAQPDVDSFLICKSAKPSGSFAILRAG